MAQFKLLIVLFLFLICDFNAGDGTNFYYEKTGEKYECNEKRDVISRLFHVEETCRQGSARVVFQTNNNSKLCYRYALCNDPLALVMRRSETVYCERQPPCRINYATGGHREPCPHPDAQLCSDIDDRNTTGGWKNVTTFGHRTAKLQQRDFLLDDEQGDLAGLHPICGGSGERIGDPLFCSRYPCNPDGGTQFCYFRGTNHWHLSDDDNSIPVGQLQHAGGNVFTSSSAAAAAAKQPAISGAPRRINHRLECIDTGLELKLDGRTSDSIRIIIIVAVAPFMKEELRLLPPYIDDEQEIRLPDSVLLLKHNVTAKFWINNFQSPAIVGPFECPKVSRCTILTCWYCWNLVFYSKCYPTWSRFVLGFYFIVFLFVLLKIIRLAIFLAAPCGKGMKLANCILCCCCCCRRGAGTGGEGVSAAVAEARQVVREGLGSTQGRRGGLFASCAIMIVLFLLGTSSTAFGENVDAPYSSFSTHTEECTNKGNNNNTVCHSIEGKLLAIKAGLDAKMALQLQNQTTVGFATIRNIAIKRICRGVTNFYTRPAHLDIHQRWNCPKKGSCRSGACVGVDANRSLVLPEMEQHATIPGFSGCFSSCEGWFCGCLFFQESCIFYYVGTRPTSNEIYRVFSCEDFPVIVTMSMELPGWIGGNSSLRNITLSTDGRMVEVTKGVSLSVTGGVFDTPPAALHRFITDGRNSWLLDDNTADGTSFQGIPKCQTEASARNFHRSDCRFDDASCSCLLIANMVQCHCKPVDISEVLKLARQLPIHSENFCLMHSGQKTLSSSTVAIDLPNSLINLNLNIDGVKAVPAFTEAKCVDVETSPLDGCYNCRDGALFSLHCKVEAPAHSQFTFPLDCIDLDDGEHRTVYIECSASGSKNLYRMMLSRGSPRLKCTLTCQNKVPLELSGELATRATFITVFSDVASAITLDFNTTIDWQDVLYRSYKTGSSDRHILKALIPIGLSALFAIIGIIIHKNFPNSWATLIFIVMALSCVCGSKASIVNSSTKTLSIIDIDYDTKAATLSLFCDPAEHASFPMDFLSGGGFCVHIRNSTAPVVGTSQMESSMGGMLIGSPDRKSSSYPAQEFLQQENVNEKKNELKDCYFNAAPLDKEKKSLIDRLQTTKWSMSVNDDGGDDRNLTVVNLCMIHSMDNAAIGGEWAKIETCEWSI